MAIYKKFPHIAEADSLCLAGKTSATKSTIAIKQKTEDI